MFKSNDNRKPLQWLEYKVSHFFFYKTLQIAHPLEKNTVFIIWLQFAINIP